ncbi:MAG: isoprenylcysteine carboxylmethyltransferase family protein [Negativicutes bacterium]|nr:isoprenylcysteine carboxylmethyltransferase family protein [Negativicutes bacterium]
MSTQNIRFIANGIITVFSFLVILGRLTEPSTSGYHWLWGIPALLILFLDIYFLTKSLLREPKGADTSLTAFMISVGGSLGFGFSAFAIGYPIVDFLPVDDLNNLGGFISLVPYPFIIWALLCLKDCMTIIPEAHAVVARGIYRYSRHPLYMCYMLWAFANMMMFPSLPMLAISAAHIAVLFIRLKREEKLLLATFTEYRSYYETTGLIGTFRFRMLLNEKDNKKPGLATC